MTTGHFPPLGVSGILTRHQVVNNTVNTVDFVIGRMVDPVVVVTVFFVDGRMSRKVESTHVSLQQVVESIMKLDDDIDVTRTTSPSF